MRQLGTGQRGPRLVVIGGRVAHQRAVAMQHIENPFDEGDGGSTSDEA